jgi:hypothetical protein
MKTRVGFVSNSSSTSFVMLFPDDFKFNKDDISNDLLDEYEIDINDVEEAVNDLLSSENISEYNCNAYNIIISSYKKYIIGSVDVSSDTGEVILADKNQIKSILGVY